jgi:hypothetical protein
MKHLTPLALSFTLALSQVSPAQPQTQPCESKNTRNTAYMLRIGDKRCEGIITTPKASLPDFELQSFTIGQLQNSPNLALSIPKSSGLARPNIQIQAITPSTSPTTKNKDKYYLLDSLAVKDAGQQWQFQWPNTILSEENIPLSKLRSLARSEPDGVILPVRFSRGQAYDLRIYTGNRTKTITLTILDAKDATIYTQTKIDQPGTEVAFTWDGRNLQKQPAPPGRYTLRLKAEIEYPNGLAIPRKTPPLQFEHKPAWLR